MLGVPGKGTPRRRSSRHQLTVNETNNDVYLTYSAIADGDQTEIDISHLAAGTYIVQVGNKIEKLVKF